jgi:hypothetical protein
MAGDSAIFYLLIRSPEKTAAENKTDENNGSRILQLHAPLPSLSAHTDGIASTGACRVCKGMEQESRNRKRERVH